MSSLRLTKTERRALRKSSRFFRSMQPSARVASVSRRGPASSPASCRSRAKAPRRGRRSTSGTLGLFHQRGHLLAHTLEVFLVLERRAHRRIDEVGVDARRPEGGQRARPVQRLRHARHLVEVHSAQALDERGNLAGKTVGGLRGAGSHDLDLLVQVGVVDPVVQAAPLQCVVHLTRAVRRDDHERHLPRLYRPYLWDRDLKVGQKLEQESLELLVRAVDLVDQQDRRSLVVVVDRVEQRPAQKKLGAEDLAFGSAPVLLLADQADVEELARVVPLVNRVREVDALITLETDEARAQHIGHDLGGFGLAHACLAFDEERLLQLEGQKYRRGERAIADVAAVAQAAFDVLDRGGGCHGDKEYEEHPTNSELSL